MTDHHAHQEAAAAAGQSGSSSGVPAVASWQEQDGLLRDLWMQNKTPQDIGEVLGRSVSAVMTRAARLGLPRRSAPGRKPGSTTSRRLPPLGERSVALTARAISDSATETARAPLAVTRVCLMCLRKFESAGVHNRICSPCKGSAEYAQASALPDIHMQQS